jgi:hypothetical protein
MLRLIHDQMQSLSFKQPSCNPVNEHKKTYNFERNEKHIQIFRQGVPAVFNLSYIKKISKVTIYTQVLAFM